jgi:hypothetical protein
MRVFALTTLSFLVACGGPTTSTVIPLPVRSQGSVGMSITPSSNESSHTVAFPIDRVWRELPGVFDALKVPVNSLDPQKRLIGNDGFKIRRQLGSTSLSRYLDCGATQIGPSADTYDVQLTVIAQLQSETTGATKVTTTINASARPIAFAQEYAPCSSKGTLEAKFNDLLLAALQR